MCLRHLKKFLQASQLEKLRKMQVASTVKLRNFYQDFCVKTHLSIFPHKIRLRYRTIKTNFIMFYTEKLESYKQTTATVMSEG